MKKTVLPILKTLSTQIRKLLGLKGGAGSGNFGHSGRPGQVGGSGGGGGASGGGSSDGPGYSESGSWAKADKSKRAPIELLEKIAKKHHQRDDLKEHRSDSLDFFETAVWSAKDSLHEAYQAGGGTKSPQQMKSSYEKIAQKHFDKDDLETRKNDSEDFFETTNVSMRDALNDAYMMGKGK